MQTWEMPMTIGEPPADPRPRYDEEIRLISQIMERADRSVRPSPSLLIIWGAISALADGCYFVYYWRYYHVGPTAAPHALLEWTSFAYVALLAISMLALLAHRWKQRVTVVDEQLTITFGIAATIAYLVGRLGYAHWVMAGPDYPMLTNALFAVPMLSIGIQYKSKPLIFGGIALVLSLVAPHFNADNVELYLGLGMLFGLVLPGLYFAVRRHA
jgi:hypothetical protein